MDITDHNHRQEAVQRNSMTPLGCLGPNSFPCSSLVGTNEVQGFSDFKFKFNGISNQGPRESDKMIIRESPGPPSREQNRPRNHDPGNHLSDFYPEKMLQNQWGTLENHFYPVTYGYPGSVGDRIQYAPFNMFSPGYHHGFHLQEFQYFVVIDFEATCDKEQIPQPQEIIEFPSVLVNSMTGQLEASFQTYVRPSYHRTLTEFCKELTGIQQMQVDEGVSLMEALFMHDKWLEEKGIKNTNFAVVTWSNWDCRVMLESECQMKRIRKPPYFNRWINLKVPFHEVFGDVRCNLKQAVQLSGLPWVGRAHCGLDDARNTAHLLALLMRRGFRFSITNSLMWPSADHPAMWPSADHPAMWQPSTSRSLNTLLSPQRQAQMTGHAPQLHSFITERYTYCFCGVMSSKSMVRKPGPKHGRIFFGCGNWTVTRGPRCPYFEWAP